MDAVSEEKRNPSLSPTEGVRLQTLIGIRWMAVAGQTASILLVHFFLGFALPLVSVGLVIGASAALNMWLWLSNPTNRRLSEKQASLQLAFDLIGLTVLLFMTGGLTNPFSVLLLAPTVVAASILGRRSVFFLNFLSITAVTSLAFTPFPLPWDGVFQRPDSIYMIGVWTGLSFAIFFLSAYVARVAREGRAHARALAATNIALEKEQQLAAIGTLAAAAAHELGTPLGTIMLISNELLEHEDLSDTVREDIGFIAGETARCREILSELRETRKAGTDVHFEKATVEALVREAAAPHENRGIQVNYLAQKKNAPTLARSTEVIHAIRNIVENAAGFAETKVDIHITWTTDKITVRIEDDGPGFDPQVLRRVGEPYVTTRTPVPGKDGGMGLGLFIAKTLLERTGARVRFGNAPTRGARVTISWKRQTIEISGD